eukprot:7593902-Pyramimonas_sp.AAC.1
MNELQAIVPWMPSGARMAARKNTGERKIASPITCTCMALPPCSVIACRERPRLTSQLVLSPKIFAHSSAGYPCSIRSSRGVKER